MVDIQHKNIAGLDAAHPPFYASESDPTTTLGAYRGWFKPSTGEAWIRNATNTAWIDLVVSGVNAEDVVFVPAGTIAATDVQAAIEEAASEAGGSVSAATEGAAGIAEIATQTETDTGTDDGRIVTPLKAATRYLAKAGGTLTGFLTLNADPTSALHAVTKQYADGLVSGGSAPASETTAGIAELATQTETNTGTDDARIVTPLKLASRTATDTRVGVVELATDAEVQAGTDTARAITAANLSARSATETRSGIAEVATQAETNAGTDDAKMVTPAKFAGRTATETQAGIAELATQAETDTGTDDNRIVTPLKAATRFLAKAGGTLTGFLTLHADPTSALHAVTKQYADGLVAGGASPASETVAGIAEIATQGETDAGTDDARIVTPLKLANYSGLGGGGSGNISGAYDIEAGSYTDAGMSDEFASGTLDAQWTTATSSGTIDFPGQPATARYDLGSRPGTLLIQPAYSTSALQRSTFRQNDNVSSGESLVLSCALPYLAKFASTTYTFLGFLLSDSGTYPGTNWTLLRAVINLTTANSSAATVEVTNQTGALRQVPIDLATSQRLYLRISRKTINSIDSFVWLFSVDGIAWTLLYQNTATNYTDLHLTCEVNQQSNPSIAPVFPVNWIRHVAATAHDLW